MVEIMSQMGSQEILKLPKNIRQIGLPEEKKKIYVEDYVVTYMNQLAAEYPNQQVAAILLGSYARQKDTRLTFIHGAIGIPAAKVEDDRVTFDSSLWEDIYNTMRQFFQNGEIVGWFMTRPGKSLGINEKITKIHVDQFPGKDKTLLLMDPLDKEEAFFIYEGGRLNRQQGYYIYYERNEEMQNYMVEQRKHKGSEEQLEAADVEQKHRRYGRMDSGTKQKDVSNAGKNGRPKKWAGTVVAALLLVVVGMNVMDMLYAPEEASLSVDAPIQEEPLTIDIPEETAWIVEDVDVTADTVENVSLEHSELENNLSASDVDSVDAAASVPAAFRYTVRKGDTLVNLSIGLYDTMDYVDLICEMNGIEDPDLIYEGMELELPEK